MKMNQNIISKLTSSLTLCLGIVISGCASINSVSVTPIPAGRNSSVKAEVSRWIILGFNFDNDYINPLVSDLKQKCPNGVVSGILTKDETISYFLVFKKHVVATGYCITPNSKPVAISFSSLESKGI